MTPKEAIERLKLITDNEAYSDYFQDVCRTAIEALEKQVEKFVDCPKGFQGVRDTRYYCPTCKELTRRREAYCHKCGQSVKYPKEVYDKDNNRIVLDWGGEE